MTEMADKANGNVPDGAKHNTGEKKKDPPLVMIGKIAMNDKDEVVLESGPGSFSLESIFSVYGDKRIKLIVSQLPDKPPPKRRPKRKKKGK